MVGKAKYSTTWVSICAYTKILSYIMDTSTVEVGWNSHYYLEVLVRYMQALQKLVLDEGCDTIEKDLSHYIMATMLLGTSYAIRDWENCSFLEWWTYAWQHKCFHKWWTLIQHRCLRAPIVLSKVLEEMVWMWRVRKFVFSLVVKTHMADLLHNKNVW